MEIQLTSQNIIICIQICRRFQQYIDSDIYYLSTSLSRAIRKYKTIADGKLKTSSSRKPLQLYIWIGIEYPKNIKYDSKIWRKYFTYFNCNAICPTKNILVSNVFAQEKGVLLNVWSRANVTSFFVCRHLGIWNSWLTMDECTILGIGTYVHYIFNKKHIFKIIGSDSTILIMKRVIKSLHIWVLMSIWDQWKIILTFWHT